MARRQNREELFQREVCVWLAAVLPRDAVFWATPNGEKRSKATAGRLKAAGVKRGIPDLFVLYSGRLVGLELKAPPRPLKSGKPSRAKPRVDPEQVAMMAALNEAGAFCVVCRSFAEIEAALRQHMNLRVGLAR